MVAVAVRVTVATCQRRWRPSNGSQRFPSSSIQLVNETLKSSKLVKEQSLFHWHKLKNSPPSRFRLTVFVSKHRPLTPSHSLGMSDVPDQRFPNLFGRNGWQECQNGVSNATLEQWRQELRRMGPEACQLIAALDFTRSNQWTGAHSFGGRCLHDVSGPPNPYMETVSLIAKTLGVYDDDSLIPCYGFGDVTTGADAVFSFFAGNQPANGLHALLERYKRIATSVDMYGPTSFAPVIRQAMLDVYNSGMKFTMLLILADGQISEECLADTKQAIVDACAFPLSIVMIGVGDGPWNDMSHFDDGLPQRPWDNFHFFAFNEMMQGSQNSTSEQQVSDTFEYNALAELPKQYEHARHLTGVNNKAGVASIIFDTFSRMPLEPPC